jgi:hypothetical protein
MVRNLLSTFIKWNKQKFDTVTIGRPRIIIDKFFEDFTKTTMFE